MPKKDKRQIQQPAESESTGLQQLDAFVGEWDLELHVPTDPPTVISGLWTTFEWMEGGRFLVGAGVPPNRISLVVSFRRPTRSLVMTIRPGTIPCITSTRAASTVSMK